MRSTLKTRHEVEAVGRDAPGFFLYGLQDTEASIKSWKTLDEMADIVHRSFNASRYPDHKFYHIGVPDVDAERGEVANIDRLPGKKIKGGKTIFRGGDIIFARIEPSIYNKKTAIVPDVGDCLGSTELLAARPKEGTNVHYLLWALRSEWVAQQILGKMTGSTGRRRFEDVDFAKLLIPWVEPDVQDQIARVVLSAKNKYLRLMRAAMAALQEGEKLVVEMLETNGNNNPSLTGYEYEECVVEDKWTNFEKLYVPSTENSEMEQMELDI
jgi:hypothetical protein